MQTFNEFEEVVKKMNEGVKNYYKKFEVEEEREIVSDGIVNEKEYFEAPIKILWILKEPYDLDNDGGGGWEINKKLNGEADSLQSLGGYKTTWQPIIYVSYAIQNGFPVYDGMDDIDKNLDMINALKKIAFMNVQKFAADTSTNDNDIKKAYKQHSEILLKQIETYNPDIIIGGNTIWNFAVDLGLTKEFFKSQEYDYWIKNNKLYIDAGHPSIRGGGEEKRECYVDDIVRIAKSFYSNL